MKRIGNNPSLKRGWMRGLIGVIIVVFVAGILVSAAQAATQIGSAQGAPDSSGRQVFRTSTGKLYAVIAKNAVKVQVWKSINGGTSWTEQDTANEPVVFNSIIAGAMGSNDILQIAYTKDASNIGYVTFDTADGGAGDDAYNTVVSASGSPITLDLAVDSNNVAHVAYEDGGAFCWYRDRVGGSWNTAVAINGSDACDQLSIAIDEDNLPEISLIDNTAGSAIAWLGNLNKATSFSSFTLDSTVNSTFRTAGTSIGIDSGGNTWVTYVDATSTRITLRKHNDNDAWGTWQTAVTDSVSGVEPSMFINGTYVYVFYGTGGGGNLKYDRYDGTSWLGSTTIQTGTYSTIKAKWSYYANNQVSGEVRVDYLFTSGSNIDYDSLLISHTPGAPTLSSPSNGTHTVGTSQVFQASATDSDGDSLKYHIKIFNGTGQSGGNCSGSVFEEQDQTSAQGGWSQSGAYTSGATASYTNASGFTRGNSYCWQVRAIDPTGSITYSSWSTPFTFTSNSAPSTPTLVSPASSQTGISVLPQFQLRTTDADNDDIQYNIKVYSTQTECNADSGTNLVRSITESDSGWQQRTKQTNTAYVGSSNISSSAMAFYQYAAPPLTNGATYWWKGRALDPSPGSGLSGSWTTCQSFTAGSSEVQINGGTNFSGGSSIQ